MNYPYVTTRIVMIIFPKALKLACKSYQISMDSSMVWVPRLQG